MREGRSPLAVLVGASASQASVSAINFGLPSIGPDLRAEFGLSLSQLGAILTAGLLGSGLFLIAAGIAVDRFGTRFSMLASVALGAGGLLLAAFAHSKWVLFGALVVFGVGTSVIPVAGAGELLRTYPAERRGWALGIRQMAVPLGGIIASGLLPLLRSLGGVQLAFLVYAGLVGLTGLWFGLVAGPPQHTQAPALRQTQRAAFGTILRASGMLRILVVAACYIVVLQSLLAFTVPTSRDAGLSPFWAGAAYFVVNVAAATARVVWGSVADRSGGTRRVRTLRETGLLASAGAALFAGALHVGTPFVLVTAFVFAFGALGWNGVLYLTAAERAGMEYAARAMGVASTVVFTLSFVMTPLVGALADRAGWNVVWLGMAGLVAIGSLVASGLRRHADG